MVSAYFMNNSG